MRIVGGALAGRTLPGKPPAGTRPTADRVREAIASALHARGLLEGAHVLDLYAGTGALGLEALSWGAAHVLAVDSSADALRCVRDNARALNVERQLEVLKLELPVRGPERAAERIARACKTTITLVLADPPYAEALTLPALVAALAQSGCLAAEATVLLEHPRRTPLPLPNGFVEVSRYTYGDTCVLLATRAQ